MNAAGSLVHVSVATIWEIAIKRGIGKLALDERVIDDLRSGSALEGLHELPIKREHAVQAGMMSIAHRDPFDRLLIAQAQLEDLTLISNEQLLTPSAFHVSGPEERQACIPKSSLPAGARCCSS